MDIFLTLQHFISVLVIYNCCLLIHSHFTHRTRLEAPSPAPTLTSLKSDQSMDPPVKFNNRSVYAFNFINFVQTITVSLYYYVFLINNAWAPEWWNK